MCHYDNIPSTATSLHPQCGTQPAQPLLITGLALLLTEHAEVCLASNPKRCPDFAWVQGLGVYSTIKARLGCHRCWGVISTHRFSSFQFSWQYSECNVFIMQLIHHCSILQYTVVYTVVHYSIL